MYICQFTSLDIHIIPDCFPYLPGLSQEKICKFFIFLTGVLRQGVFQF